MNRVSKWIEDEPERKRRQREEKRKRLLKKKDPPKHFFDDQAYMEQLRNNEDEIDSALKQGPANMHMEYILHMKCNLVPYSNMYLYTLFIVIGIIIVVKYFLFSLY